MSLNGRAFMSLSRITFLYLNGNKCIDKNFTQINETNLAMYSRIVTDHCGFCELDKSIEAIIRETPDRRKTADSNAKTNEIKLLKEILEMKTQQISALSQEMQIKNSEVADLTAAVKRLEKKVEILSEHGAF